MRAFRNAGLAALVAAAGLLSVPATGAAQARLPLSSSGGFPFPILFDSTGGLLDEGFPNEYENAYLLTIEGTPYDLLSEGIEADPAIIYDGRMILMPPQIIGDFQVSREIYVPLMGGNWARWTDVIVNLSTAARQVDVQMDGQFACCGDFVNSSDGDAGFQETDLWFVVDDVNLGRDTAKGTVLVGVDAPSGPPPIADGQRISRAIYSYAWQRNDIDAEGRLVFVTYALQNNNRGVVADDAAELTDPTEDSVAMFDLDPYVDDVENFDLRPYRAVGEPRDTPEVRWIAPRLADEGVPFMVGVDITDPNESGAPITWSWDLDGDGTFDEEPNVGVINVNEGETDGPGIYAATVRACLNEGAPDEACSVRTYQASMQNVAPIITSDPPTEAVLGSEYEYRITVEDPGGTFDESAFSTPSAPEGTTIDILGPQEARLRWRPGNLDVTGPGETILFQLLVDDQDGGQAVQSWELRVEDNRRPESPIPVYPVAGIGLENSQPRLAVANAEDVDFGDRLVYFFEIDTVDTFEGVNLRRSGPVAELPGFTYWFVEPELEVGRYFWRARASDGSLDSDWVEAEFWVVPEPVDGGVGIDASFDIGGGGDDGNCAVAERRGGGLSLLAFVALGLVLGVRRRRRR